MRLIALTAAAVLAAGPAFAADMGHPSDGFVYFHKAGADMRAHNAAVRACGDDAAKMVSPVVPTVSGLGLVQDAVSEAIASAAERKIEKVHFAANLENCMVARGWDVVRLPDTDGEVVGKLDSARQREALAAWVGAAEPYGHVVRSYAPLPAKNFNVAGSGDRGRPSLSATAAELRVAILPNEGRPKQNFTYRAPVEAGKAAPNASVIVLAVGAISPAQTQVLLARLDQDAEGRVVPAGDFLTVASPTKAFWKHGQLFEKVYVVPAPPGKWQVVGRFPIGFCLGSPAFDVGPGEAVFAGTFRVGSDAPWHPDVTLAGIKEQLGNEALGNRLRPAAYVNGYTYPCEILSPSLLYKLEAPGAPFKEEGSGPAAPGAP